MLVSFCDWMRRQRGASDATLSIYKFELRAFIKKLGEDPRMYDARNLRQFVLDKSQQSGWASARKSICAIRMFLRFLISQGRVPDESLCVGPYSRSLAALRFTALLTNRSGRKGHSVTRSDDFARKAEPSDPSLACTPGASGGRPCSASARRSRLEGRHDLCFRKGTPPGRAATDPRGRRCAAAYIKDHRPQAPFEPGRLMPPENFGIIKSKRTASGLCSRANPTCSTRMRWRRARNFTSRPFRKMPP